MLFKKLLFLLFALFQVAWGKDLYRILNVPRSAKTREIKKAFRKASVKFHPDKHQDKTEKTRKRLEKKFIEASEAYEILGDNKLRRKYDQGGWDAVKPGGDTDQGKGGGGGSGGKGGGKGGPPPAAKDPFAGSKDVRVFTSELLFKDTKRRESIVVAFHNADEPDQQLINGFTSFATKFRTAGIVSAGAVNCDKLKHLCQETLQVEVPSVFYYSPMTKTNHTYSGDFSTKSLEAWTVKVLGDNCAVLKTLEEAKRWFGTAKPATKIIFFASKPVTPPVLKALSMEFYGKASLGVVLEGADPGIAKAFRVSKKPAMLHVVNWEGFKAEKFRKDFKKRPLQLFVKEAATASQVRELTEERLRKGECAPKDSKFCVFLFESSGVLTKHRETLKQAMQRFKKDPVGTYLVRNPVFMQSFANAASGSFVLFRPKRNKYKVFAGDPSDVDGLAGFVEGALSGSPLPEQIKAAPVMRSEL